MRFFTCLTAGAAALLLSLTLAGNAPAAPQTEAFTSPENLVAYDGGARYRRPPARQRYAYHRPAPRQHVHHRPPPRRHVHHRPPPPRHHYHRPPPPRHHYHRPPPRSPYYGRPRPRRHYY